MSTAERRRVKPFSVRVLGFRDQAPAGATVINTTTRADGWSRGLSPMLLGPVTSPCGLTARNVENFWQYSKVYEEQWNPLEDLPRRSWFDWRASGFASERAERYPMGKGARPIGSWLNGQLLGYVEARKQIYVPAYSTAVRGTEAYRVLNEVYLLAADAGEQIWLLDFDGYDHTFFGMNLSDVLHEPRRRMGHAFVLAAMLQGLV